MNADVLSRLKHVRRTATGFTALCPAHEDKQNSLSIDAGREGKILLHCFVGCSFQDVVAALGLKSEDLSTDIKPFMQGLKKKAREQSQRPREKEPTDENGLTLEHYAFSKRIPVDSLKKFGLFETEWHGKPAVGMPYYDRTNRLINTRIRKSISGDRFRWATTGGATCLYGLNEAPKYWRERGFAIIVEGESDCHSLWQIGIPAVGVPGASNWSDERDAKEFENVDPILVFIEADNGGDSMRAWAERSILRPRIRFVRLPNGIKDPSALYQESPGTFAQRIADAFVLAFNYRM